MLVLTFFGDSNAKAQEECRILPADTVAIFSLDARAFLNYKPGNAKTGDLVRQILNADPVSSLLIKRIGWNPETDISRITIAIAGEKPTSICLLRGKVDVDVFNAQYPRVMKNREGTSIKSEVFEGFTIHSSEALAQSSDLSFGGGRNNQLGLFTHVCALSNDLLVCASDNERIRKLIKNYAAGTNEILANRELVEVIRKVDKKHTAWFTLNSEFTSQLFKNYGLSIPNEHGACYGNMLLSDGLVLDVTLQNVDQSTANDVTDRLEFKLTAIKRMWSQFALLQIAILESTFQLAYQHSLLEFLGIDLNDEEQAVHLISGLVENAKLDFVYSENRLNARIAFPWKTKQ